MKDPVRLREIPDIAVRDRPAIDAATVESIHRLIASLAKIDQPGYGYSATMSGSAFLPVDDQHEFGAGIIMHHGLKSSSALRQLVALGADALPFLLDSLSDKTPTQIKLEHHSGFGAMWFAREIGGNPLNLPEADAFGRQGPRHGSEEHVEAYTVKVGDLCFVAIGQIVGRGYTAVRYQPTACIVLNSPTHDSELAAAVRSIWKSDRPRDLLFRSLMRDYCSEGNYVAGDSLDVWGVGSRLQCSAVLRLLYYYPDETGALIADRLRNFNVADTRDDGPGGFTNREVGNGVRTEDFVSAVAWSPHPQVRDAVTDLFLRTTDDGVLLAAVPGVNDPQDTIIAGRLQPLLEELPPDEGPIYGRGWEILRAWTRSAPASAEAAMRRYIQTRETQRLQAACAVLSDLSPAWETQFLRPYLDDTRELKSWATSETREVNGEEVKIRLCDMAAYVLAEEDKTLKFVLEGTVEQVDRQIAELRREIDGRSKTRP